MIKITIREMTMLRKYGLYSTLAIMLLFILGVISCTNTGGDSLDSTRIVPQNGDGPIPMSHGILKPYHLDELINGSDVIVIGKVTKVLPSEWGLNYKRNENIIHTDVIIEVKSYLSGEPEYQYVAVRIWGGRVGDDVQYVGGQPEFTVGEEVALYLYSLDVQEGEAPESIDIQAVYGVVGAVQGKAEYSNGKFVHVDVEGSKLSIQELVEKVNAIHQVEIP